MADAVALMQQMPGMEDVCVDAAASRLKQDDLYASLSRMGYELETGWSAIVSIRRAGNSAGTKVRDRWDGMMGGERFLSQTSVHRRRWTLVGGGLPSGLPLTISPPPAPI